MRGVVYALLGAYWTLCIVLYPRLPDRIAIHFNARGQADGWSDNPVVPWFALPVIATLTVLLITGVSKLAESNPQLWNVPEKKRFLAMTREQRAPIVAEVNRVLDAALLYTVALCVAIQVSIYRNADAAAASLPVYFHIVMWGGLVALLGYALWLTRRLKQRILEVSAPGTP